MSIEERPILWKQAEHVRVVSFNRPERLNAVVKPLYDDLVATLKEAESDPDTKVVMLTGEGRAFCAGADLKAHAEGRSAQEKAEYLKAEQTVCKTIFELDKPVVAAVNGFAIGAGFEMALNCDFIVMANSAQTALPEVDLGTFVGGGVTWLLPQLVGLAKARELLFGSLDSEVKQKRFAASQLKAIGLVTAIYDSEDFQERALAFCHHLSNKPSLSTMSMKKQLRSSLHQSFDEALENELVAMIECSDSDAWQTSIS